MKRLLIWIGLAALLAAACGRGLEGGPAEFSLRVLEGSVERRSGDDWEPVSEEEMLSLGDAVRTGPEGWALVHLPGDQSIELAPETTIRLRQTAVSELLSGSVLAAAPRALGVGVEDVEVRGAGGLFRVDRGFQYQVRVYAGAATVPGSGWDGEVSPFREVTVVAGSIPRAPQPVRVDPEHRWDERIFESAIDIGLSLDRLERGLERQLPKPRQRDLIVEATPEPVPAKVVRGQLQSRPLSQWSEVVLASAVAAGAGADDDASTTMRQVLAMRDLGASWIVIAAEYGITEVVLDAVGEFSGILTDLIAAAVAPPSGGPDGGESDAPVSAGGATGGETSGSTGGSADGGGVSSGGSGGGSGGGGSGGGPGGGGGDPSPSPSPPPNESSCPPDDLLCGVVDEIGGIGDLGSGP